MKRWVPTLAAVFLCTGVLSAQEKPLSTDDSALIADRISRYVAERGEGLASVAVGVFNNDQTIYEDYFGYADIDAGLKAGSDTVYEWGVCLKAPCMGKRNAAVGSGENRP